MFGACGMKAIHSSIYTTGIGQHDLEVGANNSISGISGFNICNVTCVVGIHDP